MTLTRQEAIEYLQKGKLVMEASKCDVDFDQGLSWLNTAEPLSLKGNLKGKVVILDFWTYCCINCMHILPDLHQLEEKFTITDGVVVVGVHSAKFPNEKVLSNIENAVEKYSINHPVVNDSEASLWTKLDIQCWPTIAVISPDGHVLKTFIGEGHKEELFNFVECVLEVYSDCIDKQPFPFDVGLNVSQRLLSYPGKVLAKGDQLIISDTSNHRILICQLDGKIQKIIGCGKPGYKDGPADDCQFLSPQGVCKVGHLLYVTDCDSHHIRQIDLKSYTVQTLAGMGLLGNDKVGNNEALNQSLSSPWDITPLKPDDSESPLLIAMAGTHQIWAYFLKDEVFWKNQQYQKDHCVAIVGSGNEENRNNSYPMKSGLAQPSGLSIDYKSRMCYIADSESSTVRQLDLSNGQVRGLVGGERDPMNLFAFGDVDGKGVEAKLQHPLDVEVIPDTDYIVVCDSYNHKLKLVNVKSKYCKSLPLQGLNEPSGLSYHAPSNSLYIADTNNHRILRVVLPDDLDSIADLSVDELKMTLSDDVDSPAKPLFKHESRAVKSVVLQPISLSNAADFVEVKDFFQLLPGCHLTPDILSKWRMYDSETRQTFASGHVKVMGKDQLFIQAPVINREIKSIYLEVVIYYCSDEDLVCLNQWLLVQQPIIID